MGNAHFALPWECPWLPHYEKGSSTNVGKLIIAKRPHHVHDAIILAKSDFCPHPKFFAGCGPGVLLNASLKDDVDIKRLRVSYNNAYRIMHYISRNVSVRPHQVNHCVRNFTAMLRNNLYRYFKRCATSSKFFIRSLQMWDLFYKTSFFLAPVWRWPTAVVVGALFRCTRLISITFAQQRNLPCASWRLRISVFACDFTITSNIQRPCANQTYKSEYTVSNW